jgi:NitT/TauT family transport system substrate-binding protein
VPVDVGIQKGIFQRNGVNVEVINLAGSAKLHQAMVAGAIDVGLGAGTDIPFLVKGAPEIGVGAIALTPALFGISVAYNAPIHSLADLKGKTIGVSTVGSPTEWIALQLAKTQGWKSTDITIVDTGGTGAADIAGLRSGTIDATVSAAALGWDLETRKEGRLLATASEFIDAFLMNVIYATKDTAEHRPDTLRAFVKGWYEAVDFMVQHKVETDAIAMTVTYFSREVQDKQYDVVTPSLSRDGTYPPAAVEPVRQSFVDLHLLPTEPDMTLYLTTKFLPQRN